MALGYPWAKKEEFKWANMMTHVGIHDDDEISSGAL